MFGKKKLHNIKESTIIRLDENDKLEKLLTPVIFNV
jgi:hypothetical protein